jgi:hypothetical protein
MAASPLARLRRICMALPDTREVAAWGEPTFRVKKMFATYARPDSHHGKGRPAAWIAAAPGRQARMVKAAPDRFFVPAYVGVSGWIGVWLDEVCHWDELEDILRDAHRLVAPPRSQKAMKSTARPAAAPVPAKAVKKASRP